MPTAALQLSRVPKLTAGWRRSACNKTQFNFKRFYWEYCAAVRCPSSTTTCPGCVGSFPSSWKPMQHDTQSSTPSAVSKVTGLPPCCIPQTPPRVPHHCRLMFAARRCRSTTPNRGRTVVSCSVRADAAAQPVPIKQQVSRSRGLLDKQEGNTPTHTAWSPAAPLATTAALEEVWPLLAYRPPLLPAAPAAPAASLEAATSAAALTPCLLPAGVA